MPKATVNPTRTVVLRGKPSHGHRTEAGLLMSPPSSPPPSAGGYTGDFPSKQEVVGEVSESKKGKQTYTKARALPPLLGGLTASALLSLRLLGLLAEPSKRPCRAPQRPSPWGPYSLQPPARKPLHKLFL